MDVREWVENKVAVEMRTNKGPFISAAGNALTPTITKLVAALQGLLEPNWLEADAVQKAQDAAREALAELEKP